MPFLAPTRHVKTGHWYPRRRLRFLHACPLRCPTLLEWAVAAAVAVLLLPLLMLLLLHLLLLLLLPLLLLLLLLLAVEAVAISMALAAVVAPSERPDFQRTRRGRFSIYRARRRCRIQSDLRRTW